MLEMINRFLPHRIAFKIINIFKTKQKASYAMGISSLINKEHDLHIPMLDYDNKNLQEVLTDLHKLTFKYKLSTCYIYGTKKGFHAIFPFDIRSWDAVKSIVWDSKVDWRFKSFGDQYKRNFLRVAGKYKKQDIEFIGVSKSPYRASHTAGLMGDEIIRMHENLFNVHSKLDNRCLYE
jgi:hypothetical protein